MAKNYDTPPETPAPANPFVDETAFTAEQTDVPIAERTLPAISDPAVEYAFDPATGESTRVASAALEPFPAGPVERTREQKVAALVDAGVDDAHDLGDAELDELFDSLPEMPSGDFGGFSSRKLTDEERAELARMNAELRAKSSEPVRPAEDWHVALGTQAWEFAAAQMHAQWPTGREMTEAQYREAVAAASGLVSR